VNIKTREYFLARGPILILAVIPTLVTLLDSQKQGFASYRSMPMPSRDTTYCLAGPLFESRYYVPSPTRSPASGNPFLPS